jgi:hypothetical protein
LYTCTHKIVLIAPIAVQLGIKLDELVPRLEDFSLVYFSVNSANRRKSRFHGIFTLAKKRFDP